MIDFYVIAHNIRSLYNVGSIFRTSDAFGVKKIFLTGYTGTPQNPRLAPYIYFDSPNGLMRQKLLTKATTRNSNSTPLINLGQKQKYDRSNLTGLAKTALGAELTVPWEKFSRLQPLLFKLRQEKIELVALENRVRRTVPLNRFQPKFPLALLLGEEVRGIQSSHLGLCDSIVEIPMLGRKESLNVSAAYAIAAFYLTRHEG